MEMVTCLGCKGSKRRLVEYRVNDQSDDTIIAEALCPDCGGTGFAEPIEQDVQRLKAENAKLCAELSDYRSLVQSLMGAAVNANHVAGTVYFMAAEGKLFDPEAGKLEALAQRIGKYLQTQISAVNDFEQRKQKPE